MKRSKRKRGSSSSSKISAKAKPQRKPIELRFPPTEDWKNIVSDYKLMPAQADTLKFTLEEALYGIRRYQAKLKKQPSRSRLIDDLKRFEKALAFCAMNAGAPLI